MNLQTIYHRLSPRLTGALHIQSILGSPRTVFKVLHCWSREQKNKEYNKAASPKNNMEVQIIRVSK